jgi:hypothetical protein
MQSSVTIIKDYFGNVSLAELKSLSKEARKELADAIADQTGLVQFPQSNGTVQYGKAA